MSTIGQLLAMAADPGIRSWDETVQSSTQTETGLRTLADLKAKQQAEQAMLERIKNDPEVARQLLGGGPVLGSLQQPQVPPGAAPMTQQQVMPGQPPGVPQPVPGGQDLSRFAQQGAPGQSTIASLGPAGQPQPQAPQNPLLEMARTDPRAAMMLQQQMQGQQDRQWKLQEQQLSNGVKVAEYVSRMLQGVTDQNSLDQAREQIRLVHPQAASQVPQMYSKEGVAALQQRGATITEMALNRFNEAKARNLDMETQLFPELAKRFGMGDEAQAPASAAVTGAAAPPSGQQASGTGAASGFDKLSQPFRTKADSIADRLGANREDFYRVMHFETGGEMSPATRNRAGSGATGLIQFMPETAKRLGTTTEALARMSPEQQLDYVERYLEPYKGKIGSLKDLYMAVLYPAAIGKSEDTVLFSPDKTPAAYRQNAGLDAGKKGYVTVGDAVAAVERTTGGGGTRPAGGATGTAQAPAADPRIAQYETKIAQRTRDAQIASLMKNESLSTRLNDDANRLTAEKNRLEAPQQEYLKKKAVHALELQQQQQQGAAAAQLKADTDPATKEEIDAINRSLPPDKRVPYGTTRKHLREQKLVGAEPLATKVTDDLTNITTSIQNFEELSNAVTALPTGPLTQYVEGFKERWGIDISDEKVAQRAILQGATNQLLQARSGAAISEGEYQRLLRELPNEGLDPKVFKARLANTVRQFKNLYKTKVQILRQTGHAIPDSLMEPLAAPEGAPAPKPTASNVDKFKAIKP